jgi:hypothetical protein
MAKGVVVEKSVAPKLLRKIDSVHRLCGVAARIQSSTERGKCGAGTQQLLALGRAARTVRLAATGEAELFLHSDFAVPAE